MYADIHDRPPCALWVETPNFVQEGRKVKITTMICRLDGTQELREEEVADDYFTAGAADTVLQSAAADAQTADETKTAQA